MRILLLTQFLTTSRGGGEYVFWLIAKILAENNHQVTIITSKTENINHNLSNVKIVFVSPTLRQDRTIPTFIDNIRYSINSIFKGFQIMKKENIDIIHSNNFAPAFVGAILAKITKRPHIMTIHDVFSTDRSFLKLWKAQNVPAINPSLVPFFEKLVIRLRHNCVHTVSHATKEDLILLGERKPIHVVSNSIVAHRIKKDVKRFQIVYVGRLLFYKNLEVVIKAINLIKESIPKIQLVIIGSGPHETSLRKLVQSLRLESHIEFTGYLDDNKKNEIIAESCALVFPSLYEGFGLVILEAFAQEKPVLVADVRPLSEIVTHNVTGYVLEPHSERVWAEYIEKIVTDEVKVRQMGTAGYQILSTKYTPSSMYSEILKMYKSTIANS